MAHHWNYNKTAILFIIILVFNDVGSVKHSGCWIAFGDRRDLGKLADLSKLSELGKFVELSGLGESSNTKVSQIFNPKFPKYPKCPIHL